MATASEFLSLISLASQTANPTKELDMTDWKDISSDFLEKADKDFAEAITNQCSHGDTEAAHYTADHIIIQLLLVLGCSKTVEAWESVDKWYA